MKHYYMIVFSYELTSEDKSADICSDVFLMYGQLASQ